MEDRDLVDVNDAARLTGLDKATLYKLARQGQPPQLQGAGHCTAL